METLQVERAGGVVTVTLNRPEKKNAMDGRMFGEIRDTFREIAGTVDDRVVVLTGAGGDFCSGADLTGGGADRPGVPWMRFVGEAAMAVRQTPQPIIAKVVGVAVGAGCNLALGADLVVASDDARFSEIFAKRGLSVDFGGSWLLPRLVGLHKAKELVLFADVIGAAEAERIGIVNRVVPRAEIDAFVDGWAQRLVSGPPLALTMSKRLLDAGVTSSFADAVEAEAHAQGVNFTSADMAEAFAAFVEKREPVFRGG